MFVLEGIVLTLVVFIWAAFLLGSLAAIAVFGTKVIGCAVKRTPMCRCFGGECAPS